MATDFDNLPDPRDTRPPAIDPNAPPPASVTGGESAPGAGVADRLSYIAGRANRGILQELQHVDPQTGQTYMISPVTGNRLPVNIPPQQPAPDRFTAAIGSGAESMAHHPILSMAAPGLTFATGTANELLRDFPAPVREGVGAAIGLIGLSGVAHLASNAAHLAAGHFGGIGTMLHSLWSAPKSSTAFDVSNALTRTAKTVVGEGLGSETPLSRAPDKPPQPGTAAEAKAEDKTPAPSSLAGEIANRLYHWGGVLGLPSAADIMRENPFTP